MPNIDTDLFQVLTLALLFLSFLSLLAALSVLNGIKKKLDAGGATGASAPASSYDYQAPAATAYEPASSYGSTSGYGSEQSPTQEVSTGFVSVADATPAPQMAGATTALRGDEPEEQPFERDGRWWFKRGGELLVYDEGTGQWVASGQSAAAAPASTAGAATTAPAPATLRADTGEGWKCASCGAVNGSTATTCRMCFAPR